MGEPVFLPPPTPPAGPNPIVTFLLAKRAFPVWGVIVGFLFAGILGYVVHGNFGTAGAGTVLANTPTPTPTATFSAPVTIASFHGTGSQNTSDFHMNASVWALLWQCQPGQTAGNLTVAVERSDGALLSPIAINEVCVGALSGSTLERSPGDFFLTINANCNWQILVQALN